MGTHLRVLSESYPMNTNKTWLDGFQKSLRPYALDKSSLRVKYFLQIQPQMAELSHNLFKSMIS